ncbi:zinc transporter ZupT, partial [Firmicutes bacterium AF36-3BH]
IRYFIRNNCRNYGILFGIIAGIMVFISIEELLPMAREYEKKQSHYYRRHTRYGNNSAQLLLFL